MMRPAFSSAKQAAAFALLLCVVLLLPVILKGRLLPAREQNYLLQGWDTMGNFPYLHQQIFQEKTDIDIAFVGSSKIWGGIDAAYVQEKLSGELGRPAVVRTIAWGGGGYDAFYFAVRDLLQNRRVKMLVFDDVYQIKNLPHQFARRWFRFSEDGEDLIGFPMHIQLDYYFSAILGTPRNLLSSLRFEIPADVAITNNNIWGEECCLTNRLGSVGVQLGFTPSTAFTHDHQAFESFIPTIESQPPSAQIFSEKSKAMFQLVNFPPPAWQSHFAKKVVALAASKKTRCIMLHIPVLADVGQSRIIDHAFWQDTEVTLMGIQPDNFFHELKEDKLKKFFYDPVHMNQNGQRYFTSLITPTLLNLYATSTNH
jgi:hypothetical protein